MTSLLSITHADVCTCHNCTNKRNRISAFGAIRRAVTVARQHDHKAHAYQQRIISDVESRRFLIDDYLCDVEAHANDIWRHRETAHQIRRAIRAALKA